jgi:hypothetical protein
MPAVYLALTSQHLCFLVLITTKKDGRPPRLSQKIVCNPRHHRLSAQ